MSLNLGARLMVDLAKTLEEAARLNHSEPIPGLISKLDGAFAKTRHHLLPLRDTPTASAPQ
jgi:hypothetical protein